MRSLRPLLLFMAIALSNLMTVGSRATAAIRCDSVFSADHSLWNKPITLDSYAGELSESQLKQNGFKVGRDGTFYVLNYKNGKNLKMGKIKTLSVDYLFEWADKKSSDAWIRTGGVDYMDAILKDRGQQSGKGYYVSVDPFDSASYGSNLTSFRQTQKIVVLEYLYEFPDGDVANLLKEDTKFVRRLSRAGIEAIQLGENYTKTWYSVISERPLRNAGPLAKDFLMDYLDHFLKSPYNDDLAKGEVFAMLPSPTTKKVLRSFPKDNPYRRFILNEQISAKEIFESIFSLPTFATNDFARQLLTHSKRLVSEAQSANDLLAALRVQKFTDMDIYSDVFKKRSPKDQERLSEFEIFAKPASEYAESVSGDAYILTQTRMEVLRDWILEAKGTKETSIRIKWATEAILGTREDLKVKAPALQQPVG